MFARIEEFAAQAVGLLVAESLAEVLESLRRGEAVAIDEKCLEQRRSLSLEFQRKI